MNFHSESADFVMDFCVNLLGGFLGPQDRMKNDTRSNKKRHDKMPEKSTDVATNSVAKSTLWKEGGV